MRIWTGRAGSGKTTAILREIAALSEKGEGRQILLVPELNSHLMERRLAAATHNHGARTAEVLTFSRLADRVFSEVGGLAQQMLTPAGQLLTLQEAARRVQGGLSAWKGLAHTRRHRVIEVRHALTAVLVILVRLDGDARQRGV